MRRKQIIFILILIFFFGIGGEYTEAYDENVDLSTGIITLKQSVSAGWNESEEKEGTYTITRKSYAIIKTSYNTSGSVSYGVYVDKDDERIAGFGNNETKMLESGSELLLHTHVDVG